MRLGLFALVAAVLLSSAPVAHAQGGRRIAVERFRGPRAAHARSLLVRDLEDAGYVVVSDREIDAARRELGYGPGALEEAEYVVLARTLTVVAFVDGRVGHAHRAWRLVVRVRDGGDGRVAGDESWGGRTQGAIDGVGRNGAERLRAFLDAARGPAPVAPPPPPEEEERPWFEGGADPELASEEEESGDDADAHTRYDWLRISASGGSLWRSMLTTAEVYAIRRGMAVGDPATDLTAEQRGYRSSGIGNAELGLEAEFFPGALGPQPFPYLGIVASFRHSIPFSSTACRRSSPDCVGDAGHVGVATDQLDLQAGLRGRYRLGADRRDVQIFADVVYGYSTFTFDTVALQELDFDSITPPMEYQWVGIAAGFDYGIVPDALFVQLRAGYRIGVGLGNQARNVWGTESSNAGGFDVSLELKHEANWLAQGIFVSLRFSYFQFMTSFRGQVGCASSSCAPIGAQPYDNNDLWEIWPVAGDGSTVVGGIHDTVNDQNFRWGLYLGYAFR